MGTEKVQDSRSPIQQSSEAALSTAHLNARRTVESYLTRRAQQRGDEPEPVIERTTGSMAAIRAKQLAGRYNDNLQSAVDQAAAAGRYQKKRARSVFLEEQRSRTELPESLEDVTPEPPPREPQRSISGITISPEAARNAAEVEDREDLVSTHVSDDPLPYRPTWRPPVSISEEPPVSRGWFQDLLDEQARNWGITSIATGLQRCRSGSFLEFLAGSKDIVLGLGRGIFEFLGLNDIGRGIVAIANGRFLEGALGIGFGVWSLVSLGAIGLARKAVVLGFQAVARSIGQLTAEALAGKMAQEFLDKSVDQIVEAAQKEIVNKVVNQGVAVVADDVVKGCTAKFIDQLVLHNPAVQTLSAEALEQLNQVLCQQASFQLANSLRKTAAESTNMIVKHGLRVVLDKYSAQNFGSFLARTIYTAPEVTAVQLGVLKQVARMSKGAEIANHMLPELSRNITGFCDSVAQTFAAESSSGAIAECRRNLARYGLEDTEQLLSHRGQQILRGSTNRFCRRLFAENPALESLGQTALLEYQVQVLDLVRRQIVSGTRAELAVSNRAFFTRMALTIAEQGPAAQGLSPALTQFINRGVERLGLDAEKLAQRWTGKVMGSYLKKMGLEGITKFHTLQMFNYLSRHGATEIAEKFGVPKHVAWLMKVWVGKPMLMNDLGGGAVLIAGAFEYQKWLLAPMLGNIRNRIVDRPLKRILIKEISAVVEEELLEGGMRSGFQLALQKGLEETAIKSGLTKHAVELIAAQAERGFVTALGECITKLVKKGVNDAFKVWRRAFPIIPGDAISMHNYRNHAPEQELSRMAGEYSHAGVDWKKSLRARLFKAVLGKKTWRRRKDGKFDSEDEQIV